MVQPSVLPVEPDFALPYPCEHPMFTHPGAAGVNPVGFPAEKVPAVQMVQPSVGAMCVVNVSAPYPGRHSCGLHTALLPGEYIPTPQITQPNVAVFLPVNVAP